MTSKTLERIDGPSAWTAADMKVNEDWLQVLPEEEVAAIGDATMRIGEVPDLYKLRRENFQFGPFASRVQKVLHELETGRGVAVLRGIPAAQLGDQGCRTAAWGLGVHLGVPLSQSARGDLLGEVRDQGVKLGNPISRGYRGSQLLRLHSDRADFLVLVCLRPAKSGGTSKVVSSAAVHNQMQKQRPDLVAALYEPFYMSRQGDVAPGQEPFYVAPIFGVRNGRFSCQLSRSYIESAQKFLDVPRLSPVQQEALEMLSSVAEQLAWSIDLKVGDVLLVNNHVSFHARTEFEDFDEPDRKRLLLRLWISSPIGRALPESAETMWGSVEPNVVRGGVPAKDGWWRDLLSRDAELSRISERTSSDSSIG